MSLTRFAVSAVSILASAAMLIGCTTSDSSWVETESSSVRVPEQPAPEPTPEPAPEPEATPDPEATPPATTVLPASCEDILPIADYASIHDMFGASDASNADLWLEQMLGPQAWAAISGRDPRLACAWGIPQSDGSAAVALGVIDPATKQNLVTALRDSVYTETSLPGADFVFEQGQSQEHRYTDEIVFIGDVLITSAHRINGDFAQRALNSVIVVNPEPRNQ